MNFYKIVLTSQVLQIDTIAAIKKAVEPIGLTTQLIDLSGFISAPITEPVILRQLLWEQAESAKLQLQAVDIGCAIYVDEPYLEPPQVVTPSNNIVISVPAEPKLDNQFPIIAIPPEPSAPVINLEIPTRNTNSVDWTLKSVKALTPGHAILWFSEGFQLFKLAPIHWLGAILVMLSTIWLVGLFPLLGGFFVMFIWPIHLASSAYLCRSIHERGLFEVGDIFFAFQRGAWRIVFASMVCGVAIVLVLALSVGLILGYQAMDMLFSFSVAPQSLAQMITPMLGVAALIGLALVIPIGMAFYFAPILIALHDLSVTHALYLSFKGCMKNLIPLTLYSLAVLLLMLMATLPMLLGWIILLPLIATSIFVSYRQIFTDVKAI